MNADTPSYDELRARLAQAEATLDALCRGEVDLVVGSAAPLLVRYKALVEENERLTREKMTILRENQARQNRLVSVGAAIIYTLRPDNLAATWVSPNVRDLLGYTVEEALKPGWWIEHVHPHDREQVLADSRKVLETGALDHEYRFIRKDGTICWVFDRLRVARDLSGRPQEIIGAWTDITRRKQAEELLREREERFRLITGVISDYAYVFRVNPDKTLQGEWVSASFMRVFGFSLDEIDARGGWQSMVHPEDLPLMRDHVLTVVGGRSDVCECRFVTRDGTARWIRDCATAARDQAGNVVRIYGAAQDITEQKQALESQARLARAVEQAGEAILITDATGAILYVNPAFERITGYTHQEVAGRNPRLMKSGRQDAEFYQRMWAVLTAGQVWRGHFTNRRKDGRFYEDESTISPLFDKAGRIVSYVAVKRDVTEEKRLEAQFLRAQRMESMGRLAGGVAHDLNNILAPILMGASLLRQGLSPEEARPLIETIATSAQRGADIIKQLLTFARGAEGKKVPLPPSRLIKDMGMIIRETFPKSILLQTRVAADLWVVQGDPTQLHQVLLNLSVNARDAMPDGGTLTLAAENVRLDDCYAALNPEAQAGPYVLIEVADTGCGMTPEVMNRIFEPFFTTKGPDRGSGLGLATVQGIVQSHKGFIQVESEPGRGARFKVYLPAQPEASAASGAVSTRTLPPGRGELVLVVDDEQSVREMIRRILQNHGYRVLLASNGAEAVAVYGGGRADVQVLMTDLMMPVMDGVATVRVLRAMNPAIRVIVTSGAPEKGRLAEIADLTGQSFLQKPFTAEQLLATVHDALHGDGQVANDKSDAGNGIALASGAETKAC